MNYDPPDVVTGCCVVLVGAELPVEVVLLLDVEVESDVEVVGLEVVVDVVVPVLGVLACAS